ncbi:substance-K receptor-like protein, partial [Dinothrombium tinctorium]
RLLLTWNSCVAPLSNWSNRQIYVAMCLVWVICVSMAIPVFYHKRLRTRKWCDFVEVWCAEDLFMKTYWLIFLAFLVYTPLLIITFAYALTISKIKSFERKLGETLSPSLLANRRRIVKMLFIYLLNAMICWLPFQLIVLYRFSRKVDPLQPKAPNWFRTIFFIGHVFLSINGAINPIIYGIVNKTFRTHILRIYPKLCYILGNGPRSSNRVTPVVRTPMSPNAVYLHRTNTTNSQHRRSSNIKTISLSISRRREV